MGNTVSIDDQDGNNNRTIDEAFKDWQPEFAESSELTNGTNWDTRYRVPPPALLHTLHPIWRGTVYIHAMRQTSAFNMPINTEYLVSMVRPVRSTTLPRNRFLIVPRDFLYRDIRKPIMFPFKRIISRFLPKEPIGESIVHIASQDDYKQADHGIQLTLQEFKKKVHDKNDPSWEQSLIAFNADAPLMYIEYFTRDYVRPTDNNTIGVFMDGDMLDSISSEPEGYIRLCELPSADSLNAVLTIHQSVGAPLPFKKPHLLYKNTNTK